MKHFCLKIHHLGPASRTVSINSAPAELLCIINLSPKACWSHEEYIYEPHIVIEIFNRWYCECLFIWLNLYLRMTHCRHSGSLSLFLSRSKAVMWGLDRIHYPRHLVTLPPRDGISQQDWLRIARFTRTPAPAVYPHLYPRNKSTPFPILIFPLMTYTIG